MIHLGATGGLGIEEYGSLFAGLEGVSDDFVAIGSDLCIGLPILHGSDSSEPFGGKGVSICDLCEVKLVACVCVGCQSHQCQNHVFESDFHCLMFLNNCR